MFEVSEVSDWLDAKISGEGVLTVNVTGRVPQVGEHRVTVTAKTKGEKIASSLAIPVNLVHPPGPSLLSNSIVAVDDTVITESSVLTRTVRWFRRLLSRSYFKINMYLSIVIPVYNESASILPLMAEIESCFSVETLRYEVVWVDDASTDDTSEQLRQLAAQSPRDIYVKHHRRGGQSNALRSGIENAHGEVVATMDGDGQNDPAYILTMLNHLDHCNLVIGQRPCRQDRMAKRVFSTLANSVRCWATSSTVADSGCSMRAFRKDDAKICRLDFQGWHRFLVSLVELNRGKVSVVPVTHRPRRAGRSKYGVVRRGLICMLDGLAISWLRFRRMAVSDCDVSIFRGAAASPEFDSSVPSVDEVVSNAPTTTL